MKFIKNQFAPWPIVLLIGLAALAISLAASVGPSTIAVDREDHPVQQAADSNEDADSKHSQASEAAVGRGIERRQDYYDRRREYWEERVNRRLDDEDLDDEAGDDKDEADSKETKDKKDSKTDKKDGDDEDSAADEEYERIERRREYWRERVEREW